MYGKKSILPILLPINEVTHFYLKPLTLQGTPNFFFLEDKSRGTEWRRRTPWTMYGKDSERSPV